MSLKTLLVIIVSLLIIAFVQNSFAGTKHAPKVGAKFVFLDDEKEVFRYQGTSVSRFGGHCVDCEGKIGEICVWYSGEVDWNDFYSKVKFVK